MKTCKRTVAIALVSIMLFLLGISANGASKQRIYIFK